IARDSERDLTAQPFATWVHTGKLHVCQYPIADLRDDLFEQCQELGVSAIAYDPYGAQQFGDEMAQEGITAARMAQNFSMFNEPIRDLMQAMKDGRFVHDGNPLL